MSSDRTLVPVVACIFFASLAVRITAFVVGSWLKGGRDRQRPAEQALLRTASPKPIGYMWSYLACRMGQLSQVFGSHTQYPYSSDAAQDFEAAKLGQRRTGRGGVPARRRRSRPGALASSSSDSDTER
jgi:hypothetical protein